MEAEDRKQMALVRVAALGPLISARLDRGEKKLLFEEASRRIYEGPDGREIKVSARTVEDWYYAYLSGGLDALMPQERSDAGQSRTISAELGELILNLKRERPRRSIRRIIKVLERAGKVGKGTLKKSTVHRLLKHRGLSSRPRRESQERLPFRHPFAGDLWMEDVMHGPQVIAPDGKEVKAYLHGLLDSATRYVPGCAFRLQERAPDLEAVLKEALLKHGLPRGLYLDQGAAQRADSLRRICAELGIQLLHCRPHDPQAKGGIERFFRTVRDELLDELSGQVLELAELNGLLWSWLSTEYHRRVHSATGREPLEHWLSQASKVRPAPRSQVLDQVFVHRVVRQVRKDGTVRFGGRLLEVRGELAGRKVELRFDAEQREPLPKVFVDGKWVCDTVKLDVIRNSSRRRRRITVDPDNDPERPATRLDPLRLIQAEHDRRVRPPAKAGSSSRRRGGD